MEFKGKPGTIRVGNGSGFIAKAFAQWCENNQTDIQYIQPGKPMQNAHVERFNRTFGEDVLDAYIFENIKQVRGQAENRRQDYNHYHPHRSPMGMSPIQFKKKFSGAGP